MMLLAFVMVAHLAAAMEAKASQLDLHKGWPLSHRCTDEAFAEAGGKLRVGRLKKDGIYVTATGFACRNVKHRFSCVGAQLDEFHPRRSRT
ncbi:hypothetical protein M885DRAFT_570016 [Pelagophyceae sp. CCMP2097]|nr:hypothetical protein M885DRAFT_570016 [Pelagophyceae sp. CCMP2097]